MILFSFLFATLYASAQGANAMVLHFASGGEVTCLLDEQPLVTFEGDELVLTTHMNVVRYQAKDVVKFTYVTLRATDVSSTSTVGTKFFFDGDVLRARNLEPQSMVAVYTVDGSQVASAMTDKNGNVSLALPRQSGVVFAVKNSVANFKIQKP